MTGKVQCSGITLPNQPCKIRVDPSISPYCHYHQSQSRKFKVSSSNKPSPINISLRVPQPKATDEKGYIYIFTMEHLMDPKPKEQPWLKIEKLNSITRSLEDPKSLESLKPKDFMFVKVGSTVNTVEKRVQQWKDQCKQKFVIITPNMKSNKSDNALGNMFKKLSINSEKKRELVNYDPIGKGFLTKGKLRLVEKTIHEKLRKEYGYGNMICYQCKQSKTRSGVHVEWFLIPRKHLGTVMKIIDLTITELK